LHIKLPKARLFGTAFSKCDSIACITMVPQLLYHMERTLAAKAFIAHCHTNLPILAACLAGLSISKVGGTYGNSCGEKTHMRDLSGSAMPF
jgi:hypothetical protein